MNSNYKLVYIFILLNISIFLTSCRDNSIVQYEKDNNDYSEILNYKKNRDSTYLQITEKAFSDINNTSNQAVIFDRYISLGTDLYLNKRYDEALIVINNSIQFTRNSKDLALCYSMIGLINGNLDNVFLAAEFYNKALSIYSNLNDKSNTIAVLNNLGILFNNVGDFESSLIYYQRCYNLIDVFREEESKDKYKFLMNFAKVKFNLKDYKNAKQLFISSLELSESKLDTLSILESKVKIAETDIKLGNHKEGLKQFLDIFNHYKSINNQIKACVFSIEISKLFFFEGKFNEAIKYFEFSKKVALDYKLYKELEESIYFLAKIYMVKEQNDLAISYFNKVVNNKNIIDHKLEMSSFFNLYKIQKKSNQIELALSNFEKYSNLKVEILEANNTSNKGRVFLQYNLNKKKYEIENLKNERSYYHLLTVKQNQKINILIISLIIIVLILSLTYYLYKKNRSIKELLSEKNLVLLEKNEEIKSNRNELAEISNLKGQLLAIIAHDVKTPITDLYNLLFIMRRNLINMSKEQLSENLSIIESNVSNLLNLLNNILNWSVDNSKGLKYKISSFDLVKLIDSNLKLIESSVLSRSITVSKEYNYNEYIINSDYDIVGFSIRNVLSNAVKFTPDNGSITIDIIEYENKIIEIVIADTGIGLEDAVHDLLKNNAERVNSRLGVNNEKGYGIGLSMCKKMLKQINSEIYYEKNIPNGSIFIIKIAL